LLEIAIANGVWQIANVKFVAHEDSLNTCQKSEGVPKTQQTKK